MRRAETGGFLLAVVAILALATFAYIGYMFSRDPEKAEIVADGVEEATEGNDAPNVEVTTVATFESQAIHDKYVELGYPDSENLPVELADMIEAAYAEGKLPIVDQLARQDSEARALIVSAAEFEESNPNYCGLYGQELCFLVYIDDVGVDVLSVFNGIQDGSQGMSGSPIIEQFIDDRNLLVVVASGDGPESTEIGYAVPVETGGLFEVARMHAVLSSPQSTQIEVNEFELTFVMEELGQKVAGDIVINDLRVAVSDSEGDLGVIEGSYNSDTEMAVSIDYAGSYQNGVFTYGQEDAYVRVLGNLYRYNGATFTEVIE